MKDYKNRAYEILSGWKGDSYSFGMDGKVLDRTGDYAKKFGKKALVTASLGQNWVSSTIQKVTASLRANGVEYVSIFDAKPNAPREDVYRIAFWLSQTKSDMIIPIGGGSTIDAAKAAGVLASYDIDEIIDVLDAAENTSSYIEPYFGVGNVSKIKEKTGKPVIPILAVQTAASSAAHLTKYSNITDPVAAQKKLIVDDAIVPPAAVFDYSVTYSAPIDLTLDGGFDGIAHCWEVFMGAAGQTGYEKIKEITILATRLIVNSLPDIKKNPNDSGAREAIGLGTDLGGYAIMIGGTSGPHLGSFSLIDLCSHGRACSLLNPYYTVLFAEAIQDQLTCIGEIFKEAGYIHTDLEKIKGRELGLTVAKGMIEFSKSLGFPTTLSEIGATNEHLEKMLTAAKNPQLKMKLQNMPRPMDSDKGDIERLMKPTLEAAFSGELETIF